MESPDDNSRVYSTFSSIGQSPSTTIEGDSPRRPPRPRRRRALTASARPDPTGASRRSDLPSRGGLLRVHGLLGPPHSSRDLGAGVRGTCSSPSLRPQHGPSCGSCSTRKNASLHQKRSGVEGRLPGLSLTPPLPFDHSNRPSRGGCVG